MTPKEALQVLFNNLDKARLKEVSRSDKYWYKYEEVSEAIDTLERLKKFKETFDNYELAKKQDFIAYENWLECEGGLTELKRDIARYFDLFNEEVVTKEVIDEFSKLGNKLLEVGKENDFND